MKSRPRDSLQMSDLAKEDFVTRLMQSSILTYEQAEAIFYFADQWLSTINQMMRLNQCTDWKIQQTIDGFLRAGRLFLILNGYELASPVTLNFG